MCIPLVHHCICFQIKRRQYDAEFGSLRVWRSASPAHMNIAVTDVPESRSIYLTPVLNQRSGYGSQGSGQEEAEKKEGGGLMFYYHRGRIAQR